MTPATLLYALLSLSAPPDDARRSNPHFEAAATAYQNERWMEAADAFAEAYAHDPRIEFLYARGQSLRHGGDCRGAIDMYEQFIAQDPPAEAAAEAREHVETCSAQLEDETEEAPPEPTVPPPTVVTPERAVVQPSRPTDAPHWARDGLGLGLSVGGLALSGVGAALLGVAHGRKARALDAGSEQGYRDAIDGAPVMSQVGIGVLCAGGAAIVSGVIRYAIVARRSRR